MTHNSYDNPWYYNGEPLISIPEGMQGFVYMITNLVTNRKYIGRKYFYSKRKPRGKKRKVTTESDWKTYYGSCKELLEDISLLGTDAFRREILCICETRGETNYKEIEYQFCYNVLRETNELGERAFYNANIMSRYFAPPNELSEETKKKISEETRKRMSEAGKQRWNKMSEEEKNESLERLHNLTEEQKEKRDKNRAETFKNKSDEWKKGYRESISKANKGRIVSQEEKDKISQAFNNKSDEWKKEFGKAVGDRKRGQEIPQEQRDKTSKTLKESIIVSNGIEEKRIFKGDDIPEGYFRGRTDKSKPYKRVKVIYEDGNSEIYESIKALCNSLNMSRDTFRKLRDRYDDIGYKKKRKTFLNIYKCEYA